MTETIAVIGLGAMGLPMATRLATRFAVSAFDTNQDRMALAVVAGVRSAATPRDAAEGADVVLLAVRDSGQVEAALGGVDGVLAARSGVLIVTSTIGRDAIRRIAALAEEYAVPLVDAPVSGGPARAGRGDLLILVSGSPGARELARPTLEALSSTLAIVGDTVGDGQSMKTINQLLAGVHIAAAAEAIALARSMGLDPAKVVESLAPGAAGSFMFSDRGPRMVEAFEGDPEVRSRVDIFVKDMGIVVDAAREAHSPVPLAAAAQRLYLRAELAGLGADDDSTIVRLFGEPLPKGEAS
jgi:3-hydroxyisobutyrate dehydrogenase